MPPKSRPSFLTYLKAFLPALLWAGLIFILSSQPVLPGPGAPAFDYSLKKIAHIVVYGVLWWLVRRGISITHPKHPQNPKITFITYLVVFLYAASDEFHQSFVPGRHPNPTDLIYDLFGATLAWFGWRHRQNSAHFGEKKSL